MTYQLPIQVIDYLLCNYDFLREAPDAGLGRNRGISQIPAQGGRPSSPVEFKAIERAELLEVLDAVKHGRRALSPDLSEVAALRYRRRLCRKAIMQRCNLSASTYDRRLRSVRAVIAGHLALARDAKLMRSRPRSALCDLTA